jgi:hypothetical protein
MVHDSRHRFWELPDLINYGSIHFNAGIDEEGMVMIASTSGVAYSVLRLLDRLHSSHTPSMVSIEDRHFTEKWT